MKKKTQTKPKNKKNEGTDQGPMYRLACLNAALEVKDQNGVSPATPEQVLKTAKSFYDFVMNTDLAKGE